MSEGGLKVRKKK